MHIINRKYYFNQIKSEVNLNGPWQLRGYSYADYTGDNNSWKIVTGYGVLLNGEVIACNPQRHKQLHSLLEKMNIQQPRRYVDK